MISLSLRSTAHPPGFQPRSVRPSTRSYPRFSLAMDSSLGFGSAASDCAPCSDSLSLRLALSLNLAGHQQLAGPLCKKYAVTALAAPTACRRMVSGTVSLPSRGTFHLSLTVLVRYRSPLVFSLAGWSPLIRSGFHVSGPTQVHLREATRFRLRDCYPLRCAVPRASTSVRLCNSRRTRYGPEETTYNTPHATRTCFHVPGLG